MNYGGRASESLIPDWLDESTPRNGARVTVVLDARAGMPSEVNDADQEHNACERKAGGSVLQRDQHGNIAVLLC